MSVDDTTHQHFTIHNVWQQVDPVLAGEIATFWLEQQALVERRQAVERAQQVVFIARNEAGKVVGIMTAYKGFNQSLEHYFYYTRAFIHEDYRRLSLMKRFSFAVVAFFEMRYFMGLDPEVIGMYSEVENLALQKNIRDAIVDLGDYVYIGKNARGDHLRVRYFKGAKI